MLDIDRHLKNYINANTLLDNNIIGINWRVYKNLLYFIFQKILDSVRFKYFQMKKIENANINELGKESFIVS